MVFLVNISFYYKNKRKNKQNVVLNTIRKRHVDGTSKTQNIVELSQSSSETITRL